MMERFNEWAIALIKYTIHAWAEWTGVMNSHVNFLFRNMSSNSMSLTKIIQALYVTKYDKQNYNTTQMNSKLVDYKLFQI